MPILIFSGSLLSVFPQLLLHASGPAYTIYDPLLLCVSTAFIIKLLLALFHSSALVLKEGGGGAGLKD